MVIVSNATMWLWMGALTRTAKVPVPVHQRRPSAVTVGTAVEVALHACPTKLVAPVDVGVHALSITTPQNVATVMHLYFAAFRGKSKCRNRDGRRVSVRDGGGWNMIANHVACTLAAH